MQNSASTLPTALSSFLKLVISKIHKTKGIEKARQKLACHNFRGAFVLLEVLECLLTINSEWQSSLCIAPEPSTTLLLLHTVLCKFSFRAPLSEVLTIGCRVMGLTSQAHTKQASNSKGSSLLGTLLLCSVTFGTCYLWKFLKILHTLCYSLYSCASRTLCNKQSTYMNSGVNELICLLDMQGPKMALENLVTEDHRNNKTSRVHCHLKGMPIDQQSHQWAYAHPKWLGEKTNNNRTKLKPKVDVISSFRFRCNAFTLKDY